MGNDKMSKYQKICIVIMMLALICFAFNRSIAVDLMHNDRKCNLSNDIKLQDKYSLDWDSEDSANLGKLSTIMTKNTVNDTYLQHARIMLVTLNRVFNTKYANNIREVCVNTAEEYGFSEEELDSEDISDKANVALSLIMIDKFDDTYGFCDYDSILK